MAHNYGLLETKNGLLWGVLAYIFWLLGVPGRGLEYWVLGLSGLPLVSSMLSGCSGYSRDG